MKYVLFILGAGILPRFLIRFDRQKEYPKSLVFKILSSLTFVILGIMGYAASPGRFSALVLAALIAGFIGDVFLHVVHLFQENMALFYIGASFFALGHVFYIAAMLQDVGKHFAAPLLTGLVLAFLISLCFQLFLKPKGVFRLLCFLYIAFVISFAAFAGARYFLLRPESGGAVPALALFTGAVCFAASDLILIFDMISVKKYRFCNPALLTLYYLGQCLIALSLLL